MDLSALTVDTFSGRVGETFRDAETGRPFELVSVTDHSESGGVPEGHRAPFSLLFRVPDDHQPEQATRPLAHDDLGTLEVFVVPVAREADGLRYQAVFS